MCRQASLELSSRPSSVGQARHFLASAVARWELPQLRDDLVLAVSEVVTNTVVHAHTPMSIHAAVTLGVMEVGVRDADPHRPVVRARRSDLVQDLDRLVALVGAADDPDPRHPDLWVGEAGSVQAGRGLHLLTAVSDSWGVTPTSAGKEVWFTLAVPSAWPYTADCTCGGAATRTASGRPLVRIPGPWD